MPEVRPATPADLPAVGRALAATFDGDPVWSHLASPKADWSTRAAAVVCGDTLPVKKPDPAPVLLACERAGLVPGQCLFVGDDRRDVQAGTAAGLFTVAASWGYLDGGDPHAWDADVVLDHPAALAALLQLEPATA